MLLDRGIAVDHTTLFRWVQAYTAKLEQRMPRRPAAVHTTLPMPNSSRFWCYASSCGPPTAG